MARTLVRRVALLGLTATAIVTLAACGGSTNDSSNPMSGMHGNTPATASSSAAAFNHADVMFAQMMISHHQQAVEMAKLAATRASNTHVKELAQQIETAQGPEITTMTGWLNTWGEPTTTPSTGGMNMGKGSTPGMMSDTDLKTLAATSGTAFDRQFLTMMIAHHQGAISMAKDELANGRDTDAKALAQHILTSQQTEIDTMNSLLKTI